MPVDERAVRRVIVEQDELLRQKLQQDRALQVEKAAQLAAAIAPWVGRSWERVLGAGMRERRETGSGKGASGRLKPGALRAIRAAEQLSAQTRESINSGPIISLVNQRKSHEHFGSLKLDLTPHFDSHDEKRLYKRAYLEEAVRLYYESLVQQSRGQVPYPIDLGRPILEAHELRPPRHAVLVSGVLGRNLLEDLDGHIETGVEIERALANRSEPPVRIADWIQSATYRVLSQMTPALTAGLSRIVEDLTVCDAAVIDDPYALRQAYTAEILNYLQAVRQRMPDYIEASGQRTNDPTVSMTFNNSNIGQVASQISNNDAKVVGLAQPYDGDVVQALDALQQAVRNERTLMGEEQAELLERIEYLSKAAQSPPHTRDRFTLKSVLTALNVAAASGSDLSHALSSWSGVLSRLIP